ncbi:MAG: zinc ribbon domain-containing protein [Bacillota bacterium]|nr:zinc ribbon domain-containing protein [Bacillota bacterium]
MYCIKCGAELSDEALYCFKCGQRRPDNGSDTTGGAPVIGQAPEEHPYNFKLNEEHVSNAPTERYIHQSNLSENGISIKLMLIIILAAVVTIGSLFSVIIYRDKIKYVIAGIGTQQFAGISKDTAETQLRSVIDANAEAMEQEDWDKYLTTVSLNSEQLAQTKEQLNTLFKDYDLEYTIENFELLTEKTDDAQVRVVQVTRKKSGPAFRDNRSTFVHHLKNSNGTWKIFKSDIQKVEYMDEKMNSSDAAVNPSDGIRSVIALNLAAMQEENMDKYLSTIYVTDGQIEATKDSLKKVFDNYDLRYTIESLTTLSTSSNDAQVEVVMLTEKFKGPDFRNNRTTTIHHLKKINGQWKIYKSDIKNVQYLNDEKSATSNTAAGSTTSPQPSTVETTPKTDNQYGKYSIGGMNLMDDYNTVTASYKKYISKSSSTENTLFFNDGGDNGYGSFLMVIKKNGSGKITEITYSNFEQNTDAPIIKIGLLGPGDPKSKAIEIYGKPTEEATEYDVNRLIYKNIKYNNNSLTLTIYCDTKQATVYGYEIDLE